MSAAAALRAAGPAAAGTTEAVAFIAHPETAVAVRMALGERHGDRAVVEAGASRSALDWLSRTRTPPVLFVDLSDSEDPVSRLNQLAEHCDPGTRVVVLGPWNDVGLYRRMRDMGVDEYFSLPAGVEDIRAALDRLNQTPEGEEAGGATAPGRRIVVLGVRGGVGATSLALSMAWTLSREQGCAPAALLDLDLAHGDAALQLDREPPLGLAAALAAPERIDSLLLSRAALKVDDRLTLYGGPESAPAQPVVAPAALSALLAQIDESHPCTVVDLPRYMDGVFETVVADAAQVLLVTAPTLSCMRDAIRLKEMLSFLTEARIDLVVNRIRKGGERELDPSMVAKAFGAGALAELPDDARLAVKASAKARPLVALSGRRSPLARGVRALCEATAPADEERAGRRRRRR